MTDGPYTIANLGNSRALTLERELLKRFGTGRQYLGTVEAGQDVCLRSMCQYNHTVISTRLLRKSESWAPDPLINRIRNMLDFTVYPPNSRLLHSTVHVWHNAIAVINMRQ